MSTPSPTSLLRVDPRPGKPPMLQAEAAGDAPRWAADHRDALRAVLAEHGSLLVRGLGLRDAAETEAVFRQLGSLMTEREAFAPRRSYTQGVYSSSKWPPAHRPAVLVQPSRLPQRVDDRAGGARVPRGRLRRRWIAVQYPLRRRRPDRRGCRAGDPPGLRGKHRTRAVAGRRPDDRGQHPHRARQGAL